MDKESQPQQTILGKQISAKIDTLWRKWGRRVLKNEYYRNLVAGANGEIAFLLHEGKTHQQIRITKCDYPGKPNNSRRWTFYSPSRTPKIRFFIRYISLKILRGNIQYSASQYVINRINPNIRNTRSTTYYMLRVEGLSTTDPLTRAIGLVNAYRHHLQINDTPQRIRVNLTRAFNFEHLALLESQQ